MTLLHAKLYVSNKGKGRKFRHIDERTKQQRHPLNFEFSKCGRLLVAERLQYARLIVLYNGWEIDAEKKNVDYLCEKCTWKVVA